jgi:hypothetical protein
MRSIRQRQCIGSKVEEARANMRIRSFVRSFFLSFNRSFVLSEKGVDDKA